MKIKLTLVLLVLSGGVMAHDGGQHQMTAQEMQVNAIERWSRMITHDQRVQAAQNLKKDSDRVRQQNQSQPNGYQPNGYTGEGDSQQ